MPLIDETYIDAKTVGKPDYENDQPKEFDLLVFIGRFQPFHLGHQRVVDRALAMSEKVLILLGSSNQPRSFRNPWTYSERVEMIWGSYRQPYCDRIAFAPIEDIPYNDSLWITQVQRHVKDTIVANLPGNSPRVTLHGTNDFRIGLIGCEKDHTSYYLKLFPGWDSVPVKFLNPLAATDIRADYFNGANNRYDVDFHVNSHVRKFLIKFAETDAYQKLYEEHQFIAKYKQQWANVPYDPVFVTTDAVVVQSGHVLMVERGAAPGKGLMALPGGFLDNNERIVDSMIRELNEETKIKVPEKVLRGSIVAQDVFDAVNRSSRGRTITHAFLIKLDDRTELPKVKGSDDAAKAFWVPLSDLDPKLIYEDHFHIIQSMVGLL